MDLPVFDALDPAVLLAAVVVLVVAVLAALLVLGRRRSRKQAFEDHFGAEYEVAVRRAGSRHRAEADLERRLDRRAGYEVRRLEARERDRFQARWRDLQASFVDGPELAARGAVTLVIEAAVARGYPEGIDRCLDDVSVDHPDLVAAVRHSRSEGKQGERPSTTTERHRTTLLHARTLFERLIAERPAERLVAEHSAELAAERRPETEAVPPPPPVDEPSGAGRDLGDALLGPDGRPLPST